MTHLSPKAASARANGERRIPMQNRDVLDRQMTRRLLLGAAGMGGLAFLPAPARGEETVDLRVPGGPSTRAITTAYPQKGRMILQRTSPPWLETPFEVFDKGVFTPNDQHYVSWHWANFPSDIDVDTQLSSKMICLGQTLFDERGFGRGYL
jgi:hypothetical protein